MALPDEILWTGLGLVRAGQDSSTLPLSFHYHFDVGSVRVRAFSLSSSHLGLFFLFYFYILHHPHTFVVSGLSAAVYICTILLCCGSDWDRRGLIITHRHDKLRIGIYSCEGQGRKRKKPEG